MLSTPAPEPHNLSPPTNHPGHQPPQTARSSISLGTFSLALLLVLVLFSVELLLALAPSGTTLLVSLFDMPRRLPKPARTQGMTRKKPRSSIRENIAAGKAREGMLHTAAG